MDSLKTSQEITTLLNTAIAEHQNGHLQPALNKYLEILNSSPKHPDALHLAGLIHYQSGQNSLAIEYIETAISISPNQASYYSNLGLAYAAENNFDDAIESYKKAIKITPNYPEARYNLGNAYRAIGKKNSAIKNYKKAIQMKPDYAQAYNSLGLVLQKKGEITEAQIEFKKALSFDSSNYSIYNNLGVVEADLDNPSEAISNLERAIYLLENNQKSLSTSCIPEKKHIDIYHNIGLAYINVGDFKKAINFINQALLFDNSDAKIRFSRSIAYLGDGNFPLGWEDYVFRPKKEGITNKYLDILGGLKEWDLNKSPRNIPLVILPEQGIGDEIMFASIIPDLIKSNEGEITLACDNRLISIFQRSFKNITITTLDNLKTTPDMQQIHIGSLPQYFRGSESDFKPPQPYISPNNETTLYFHDKYSYIEGLRVGIAWKSGNPDQGEKRSLPLNQWKDMISIPGCTFFNLQYGDVQQEIDEFTSQTGIEIINDKEVDQLKSIEDFIAQISTLDLIITIDNSTAHIAGALGVPTWVMLQHNCDWRWMRGRYDSLWYKSLRLYRQKEIGNWSNVTEEIIKDLTNRNIQPKAEPRPPIAAKPTQSQPQKKKEQACSTSQKQKSIKTDRKIAFLNDTTAWYHWGCTATSEAIRKRIIQSGYKSLNVPINFTYNFQCIPQNSEDFDNPEFFNNASKTHNDLFQAINSCDQVVINGEGSIHHLSKVSLSLLYMAYAAKKFLNKPVHIINHSPYPNNTRESEDNFAFQLYKAIYNQLHYVAIREHISHKLMTSYGVNASLSFDCLPITVTEDYKPEKLDSEKNIVMSGSVSFSKERIADLGKLMLHFHQQGYKIKVLHGAKAFPAQDDQIFIQELQKIDFKSYEVIDAKSLTEWFDCINSAAVFISGRFHHSLAAIYLETPCVMMESNTLKNVALAETFNLLEPIKFDSENFFDELLERTEKALKSEPIDIAHRKSLLQRSEVNFAKIPEFG